MRSFSDPIAEAAYLRGRAIANLRKYDEEQWEREKAKRVRLKEPHDKQRFFVESQAKRNIIRAGRRGGKTTGVATRAVRRFLEGYRVLYAVPTTEQIDRFWAEVKWSLAEAIDLKLVVKNETRHLIERPGTENRIRAKTAWNADTLRGDYADELILDEWQLMDEDAWRLVGAPMLLDNNGCATFCYTPPSARSRSTSKASDKRHASKMYARATEDKSGRWRTFHFTSQDNPFLSREAFQEIVQDMSSRDYEQEIEAKDKDDNPNALWKFEEIEKFRVVKAPTLFRVGVAIDPSASGEGNEAGIVGGGIGKCACKGVIEDHGFLLEDATLQGSPDKWASAGVTLYHKVEADVLVAEKNNGGEMVATTIKTVKDAPPVKLVHASRGKEVRAEPVSALSEQGKIHHVGRFPLLEDELTNWEPGDKVSPNRLDAFVWLFTELMLGRKKETPLVSPFGISRTS